MNPAQHLLTALVRVYRWALSPAKLFFFGPQARCRFTPTCSEYALEAVQRHGAVKGALLSAGRVCRCHPWGGCGHDPVPQGRPKIARHISAGSGVQSGASPAGTKESSAEILSSLRDSTTARPNPVLKHWAIPGRPCGTSSAAASH